MRNDTEQFRRECEARYVLLMDDERREAFYQGVLKERGREAANQLIGDVNKMRKKQKGSQSCIPL